MCFYLSQSILLLLAECLHPHAHELPQDCFFPKLIFESLGFCFTFQAERLAWKVFLTCWIEVLFCAWEFLTLFWSNITVYVLYRNVCQVIISQIVIFFPSTKTGTISACIPTFSTWYLAYNRHAANKLTSWETKPIR